MSVDETIPLPTMIRKADDNIANNDSLHEAVRPVIPHITDDYIAAADLRYDPHESPFVVYDRVIVLLLGSKINNNASHCNTHVAA